VLHVALGRNYQTAKITAQIHDDRWYHDTDGHGALHDRDLLLAARGGLPRGLLGAEMDQDDRMGFALAEQYVERNDGAFDVSLTARFKRPSAATSLKVAAPLVSLAATFDEGGTLAGPRTYFYALSAVDEDGIEGPLSFLIPVHVAADSGSKVTLTQIRLGKSAKSFNVYRGARPQELMLVAPATELADSFEDAGLSAQLSAPPDPNYDHANLYWRSELLPPTQVSASSADTVGSSTLALVGGEYVGKIVRIVNGRGQGQERLVSLNTETTLTVQPAWSTEPDATSEFVIA
jgi:hypothetical protein